jgi:uncharacterized Zn-finger protein
MATKICERCGKNKLMLSWESLCYECQKIVELEKIQANILEATDDEEVDTFSSDYVICPYCGEAMDNCYGYEDFPELYEEGDHLVTCPNCDKEFVLETSISYYYETHKKGE